MPRPERDLDPDAGPVQSFACDLRRLRREAGNPTYRELARVAHYSPATLAAAAGGRRLPSLPVALGYVRACRGDEAAWRDRWLAVRAETGSPSAVDSVDASPAPGTPEQAAMGAQRRWFSGRRRVLLIATAVLLVAGGGGFALRAVGSGGEGTGVGAARAGGAPVPARAELVGIDHFGDGVIRAWPNTGAFPAWPWAGPVGLNSGWTEPDRARFADLDGDGYEELIAVGADGTVSAARNNRRFPAWPWHAAVGIADGRTGDPDLVQFADLDGDRRAELVETAGRGGGTMRVWPGTGRFPARPWGPAVSAPAGWAAPALARLADLDGDGRAELVGVSGGRFRVWHNTGRFPAWPWAGPVAADAGWTDPAVNAGWTDLDRVRFADLDGDGYDELIAIVADGTITAAGNNHRFPAWPWHTSVEVGRGWDGKPDVIQFADLDGTR